MDAASSVWHHLCISLILTLMFYCYGLFPALHHVQAVVRITTIYHFPRLFGYFCGMCAVSVMGLQESAILLLCCRCLCCKTSKCHLFTCFCSMLGCRVGKEGVALCSHISLLSAVCVALFQSVLGQFPSQLPSCSASESVQSVSHLPCTGDVVLDVLLEGQWLLALSAFHQRLPLVYQHLAATLPSFFTTSISVLLHPLLCHLRSVPA